uniref:Peptide/nickel transport system substrate-binding protein n=1 Tax=Candidatus Kentrum sp. TUN TaxID=2126343 RepID=A0A450ZG31_9GAMM|nr:MAG: peptide/nickel transport system substrate-binding protein [Candidatus Kentron sp. TUN]VFK52293.1 MAG: peptide/nickel transport system substrate-binding protein [Candidatus Kentron sp. TUN]VFK52717.1 MAG: peptide/nickel transport system substrate-binding protein [Candidatus Kentron sp. TUN]
MKPWLLLVCLALVSACNGVPSDSPSEAIPQAIRFGLAANPITLDPRFDTDAASMRITRLLYDRLVDFDEASRAIPALADWHRVTPLHYRFILKAKRRHFHNGSPLTAFDVKATYDSVLDKNVASPHRSMLIAIEKIVASDKDTIDFHLQTPDPLFPGRLVLGILPGNLIAQDYPFNRKPIGSGPLALLAWPEEGKLRLQRIEDDQVIEFIHTPEATVRVLKLLRGEIDLIQNDILPELTTWLSNREDVIVKTTPGTNFAYLGFHLEDPVAGNPDIRKAVAHALDREAIIHHVWGGAARLANGLLTPNHWAGHPSLRPIPFDPIKAKALLAKAGYTKNHKPNLIYKTSNNPLRLRLATIIQDQLRQVGIDVDLRSYDWGTFYGDIKAGRFQMYSLAWVSIKMPDIFKYAFHSVSIPPVGANRGRFMDAFADHLIDEAEAASNPSNQANSYRELQEYLLIQLPYIPLWYEDNVLITRGDVTGYELTPDGNYDGLLTVRRTAKHAKVYN